jgi:hypothetical protein
MSGTSSSLAVGEFTLIIALTAIRASIRSRRYCDQKEKDHTGSDETLEGSVFRGHRYLVLADHALSERGLNSRNY